MLATSVATWDSIVSDAITPHYLIKGLQRAYSTVILKDIPTTMGGNCISLCKAERNGRREEKS